MRPFPERTSPLLLVCVTLCALGLPTTACDSASECADEEIYYNGVDDDCDPFTRDGDRDGDGEDWVGVDGEDCDDDDPRISSRRTDLCGDGIDSDCDDAGGPGQPDDDDCLDPSAPRVTVRGPSTGSDPVAGFVRLEVEVSDPQGVASITWSLGDRTGTIYAAAPGEAPERAVARTATIDTDGLPEGPADLEVEATDVDGAPGRATLELQIDRTGPVVTLEPADPEPVAGASPFRWSASDPSGVTSVVFTLGPDQIGAAELDEVETTSTGTVLLPMWAAPNGTVDLRAIARDGTLVDDGARPGNAGDRTIPIDVDNPAPAFTIENPIEGETVLGDLRVFVGWREVVPSSAELFLDGLYVARIDSFPPPSPEDYPVVRFVGPAGPRVLEAVADIDGVPVRVRQIVQQFPAPPLDLPLTRPHVGGSRRALVVADVGGDPTPDLVLAGGDDVHAFEVEATDGGLRLAAERALGLERRMEQVWFGDLDGDGGRDGLGLSGRALVRLEPSGDRGGWAWRVASEVEVTDGGVEGFLVAQLDADPAQEILLFRSGSEDTLVQWPELVPEPGPPDFQGTTFAIAADLDRDGRTDLVSLKGDLLEIRFDDGLGFDRWIPLGGQVPIVDAAAGDLNADEHPDLALLTGGFGEDDVLLVFLGPLRNKPTAPAVTATGDAIGRPAGLLVLDLDRDGTDELVTLAERGQIQAWSIGPEGLEEQRAAVVGAPPRLTGERVLAALPAGDAGPHLVSRSADGITLVPNRGPGRLVAPVSVPTGGRVDEIVIGSFTRAGPGEEILLVREDIATPIRRVAPDPRGGWALDTPTLPEALQRVSSLSLRVGTRRLVTAGPRGGRGLDALSFPANTGSLRELWTLELGPPAPTATATAAPVRVESLASVDFEGDGDSELVVSELGGLTVLDAAARRTLARFSAGASRLVVAEADGTPGEELWTVDTNSGRPALLDLDPDGRYSLRTSAPPGAGRVDQTYAGDLDGDGVDELLTVTLGQLLVWRGQAGGGGPPDLSNPELPPASLRNDLNPRLELVLADLNGDGRDDIAQRDGTVLSVWLLDERQGELAPWDELRYPLFDAGGSLIRAGDVNGDGRTDLVLSEPLDERIIVVGSTP